MDGNGDERARLPAEPIHRITGPVARFLRIEAGAGVLLLLSVLIALIVSNSPWASQFEQLWETPFGLEAGSLKFSRTLREWINDGLMTLFFFVVALELKRELVLGELRHPRMAALPIAAALGGMIVPATLFLAMQRGQAGEHGWGTVMATDTAFVVGCLVLLKSAVPQSLRVFMLSVAIVDDIGAILVVTMGYAQGISFGLLGLSAITILVIRAMSLLGIRSIGCYVLAGSLLWLMIDLSGIHATITGVVLGLMTPTARWISDKRLHAILDRIVSYPLGDHWSGDTEDRRDLRMGETAARETLSPVERLEMRLHPWVGFLILPLFALANAGVLISFADLVNPLTGAIIVGLALGKPIGILSFSWLALRMRVATKPRDLNWKVLAGGAMLAGIGFTMSVFIANLAFSANLINSAKLGILLASIVSAVIGMGFLWITRSKGN